MPAAQLQNAFSVEYKPQFLRNQAQTIKRCEFTLAFCISSPNHRVSSVQTVNSCQISCAPTICVMPHARLNCIIAGELWSHDNSFNFIRNQITFWDFRINFEKYSNLNNVIMKQRIEKRCFFNMRIIHHPIIIKFNLIECNNWKIGS